MLLTSSQVSVAASSGIVIFFTAALFLSGYAIQQRTLKDLRAAIKPKPSPKTIIQDQFKKPKNVLVGGAVVGTSGTREMVVEVRPTPPDDVADALDKQQQQIRLNTEEDDFYAGPKQRPEKQPQQEASADEAELEKPEKPISRAERRRRIKEEIMKLAEGQERGYYQRRLW